MPLPCSYCAQKNNLRSAVVVTMIGMLATGCIPIPVAVPPLRVSGTFGGGSSGLPSSSPGANELRGRSVGRLGLSPMSMSKRHIHRPIDPEIGMVFEGLLKPPQDDLADFGGYLGVAWRVWQDRIGSGGQRVFVRGTGDLVKNRPNNTVAGGGSLSVGWEYTDFVSSEISDGGSSLPAFFGYGHGEGGIGVELAVSGRAFPDAPVWQVTAGVTARLPAVIGLLLVPIK